MRWPVTLLAAAPLLVGTGGIGRAAPDDGPAAGGEFRYAAKVACSLFGTFQDDALVDGLYRTAVNVLNPSDREVAFGYRVSLAQPATVPPGEEREALVTDIVETTLGPDEALAINCFDMAGLFCPFNEVLCIDLLVIEGFLIVRSPVELDVVAVYSARTSRGETRTLDVEAVAPR